MAKKEKKKEKGKKKKRKKSKQSNVNKGFSVSLWMLTQLWQCVHHQLKHLHEKAKNTSIELTATNQDLSQFKNNLAALSGGQTVYCFSDYTSNCILQCQLAHHILQDIPLSRLNKYKTELNIVKISEAASQFRLHPSNRITSFSNMKA